MNKVQERLKVAIHDIALSYLSWGHDRVGEYFAHILREYIAGNEEISIRQLMEELTDEDDGGEAAMKLEWEIISHFERRGFSVETSTDEVDDGKSVCSIWVGTPKTVYLTLTH